MIDTHAAAAKTLLETTERTVYDSKATGTDIPPNYIVFYLSTPEGRSRRLSADAPKERFLLSTKCVGSTPWEVRDLLDRVRGVLLVKRLVVAGRNCSPFVAPRSYSTVRPDDTINPPAYVATDPWPFTSSPVS